MKPVEVPTRETVSFLTSRLPAGASILEVGCGEGHVAAELMRRGFRVVGLDSDAEFVAQAQGRGVSATAASWPDFESAPVDAVAFTRSLHHIGALTAAIRRAREALRPNGVLLIEDFAFDEADPATIRWFVGMLRSHPAGALITPASGEFATELLAARDPVDAWRENHHHDLHSITAMTEAVAAHFAIREAESAPYLYRYLVPVLPETPEAAGFVEDVLREETRTAERGQVRLIGRRIVGVARTSTSTSAK